MFIIFTFVFYINIPWVHQRIVQMCRLWGSLRQFPQYSCTQKKTIRNRAALTWVRNECVLVWNSLIRGKYVANNRLTASDENTLEHSKHSYIEDSKWRILITDTLCEQLQCMIFIQILTQILTWSGLNNIGFYTILLKN